MKNITSKLVKYFLVNHPNSGELAVSRLTKLVYLSDWKNALEHQEQITDTNWIYDQYGPYVTDILDMAKDSKEFKVSEKRNTFGSKKQVIELISKINEIDLDDNTKKIADFVINATKNKTYNQFINLVYSTYPVISNDKFSKLDLVGNAASYQALLSLENHEELAS